MLFPVTGKSITPSCWISETLLDLLIPATASLWNLIVLTYIQCGVGKGEKDSPFPD